MYYFNNSFYLFIHSFMKKLEYFQLEKLIVKQKPLVKEH